MVYVSDVELASVGNMVMRHANMGSGTCDNDNNFTVCDIVLETPPLAVVFRSDAVIKTSTSGGRTVNIIRKSFLRNLCSVISEFVNIDWCG
ncbi:unnamed protein product [Haemonchus placei]|uniref:Uncharacterized protein n=1 Tax=Haemonchus placei TaxID=6290 RepID=A0A3P7ZBS2_HAEPC|nr:unnamed protein product [Haemonchus placei]